MTTPYVYLAGPMSGLPLFNFPAFAAARADLRARGMTVTCPAEEDERAGFDPATDPALPFAEYMQRDLPLVCASAGVVVLPGWRESRGARLEVTVAQALGLPVLAYPDLAPIDGETILEEAQRIVHGPRREAYGHPADNFQRAALLMGAWLDARGLLAPGAVLTAEDTAALMIQGKLARQCHKPTRDNLTDVCGYAAAWQATIERGVADSHSSRDGFTQDTSQIGTPPADFHGTPAAGRLADTSHAGLWRSAALPWELTP